MIPVCIGMSSICLSVCDTVHCCTCGQYRGLKAVSILSPKATDDPFGLPLITRVRCHVRTTASETEALVLPVCKFGTVCHVSCEHLTSATTILKHYWRHICLTRPRRFVTYYIRTLEILLLTHSLTHSLYPVYRHAALILPYVTYGVDACG